MEHEASTSKIGDDQIFYCNQRGISTQDAVNMIVNEFCKDVFQKLPMDFAVEAQKLLGVSLGERRGIAAEYWRDAHKVLADSVRRCDAVLNEAKADNAGFDLQQKLVSEL